MCPGLTICARYTTKHAQALGLIGGRGAIRYTLETAEIHKFNWMLGLSFYLGQSLLERYTLCIFI